MPMNSTVVNYKGRLCRKPVTHVVGEDRLVAGVTIAIDDDRKVGEKWEENTIFLFTEGWGKLGVKLSEMQQGDEVFVTGKLKQSRYTPEGEDKPRVVFKVWADSINKLRSAKPKADEQQQEMDDDAEKAMNKAASGDVPF